MRTTGSVSPRAASDASASHEAEALAIWDLPLELAPALPEDYSSTNAQQRRAAFVNAFQPRIFQPPYREFSSTNSATPPKHGSSRSRDSPLAMDPLGPWMSSTRAAVLGQRAMQLNRDKLTLPLPSESFWKLDDEAQQRLDQDDKMQAEMLAQGLPRHIWQWAEWNPSASRPPQMHRSTSSSSQEESRSRNAGHPAKARANGKPAAAASPGSQRLGRNGAAPSKRVCVLDLFRTRSRVAHGMSLSICRVEH